MLCLCCNLESLARDSLKGAHDLSPAASASFPPLLSNGCNEYSQWIRVSSLHGSNCDSMSSEV